MKLDEHLHRDASVDSEADDGDSSDAFEDAQENFSSSPGVDAHIQSRSNAGHVVNNTEPSTSSIQGPRKVEILANEVPRAGTRKQEG